MSDFLTVCKEISERLSNLPYDNGDSSDIGNEIGIVLGLYLSDGSFGWEKDDFISGLNHGIDLKKYQEFHLSEIMRMYQENGLYDNLDEFDKDKNNL
jgi:hypothetical protein